MVPSVGSRDRGLSRDGRGGAGRQGATGRTRSSGSSPTVGARIVVSGNVLAQRYAGQDVGGPRLLSVVTIRQTRCVQDTKIPHLPGYRSVRRRRTGSGHTKLLVISRDRAGSSRTSAAQPGRLSSGRGGTSRAVPLGEAPPIHNRGSAPVRGSPGRRGRREAVPAWLDVQRRAHAGNLPEAEVDHPESGGWHGSAREPSAPVCVRCATTCRYRWMRRTATSSTRCTNRRFPRIRGTSAGRGDGAVRRPGASWGRRRRGSRVLGCLPAIHIAIRLRNVWPPAWPLR
jgi:hypothetical protein